MDGSNSTAHDSLGRSRRASLRIAVWIQDIIPPAWIQAALKDLIASPYADVVEVRVINDGEPEAIEYEVTRSPWYRVYTAIDGQRNTTLADPLGPYERIELFLAEAGVQFVSSGTVRPHPSGLDLIILLEESGELRNDQGVARLGLCVFRFGSSDEPPGPPGFWPVMMNRPTSTVDLILKTAGSEDRRLMRATSRTDRFSVRSNRSHLLWRASSLPVKLVKDLSLGDKAPRIAPFSPSGRSRQPRLSPLPFMRLLVRWVWSVLSSFVIREHWFLAYRIRAGGQRIDDDHVDVPDLEEFHILHPPCGYDWADPFPVARNDRYWIFFEEVRKGNPRAHISVLELTREGKIASGPTTVLERPYHLSYPFLLEQEGELFMVPETAECEAIELYRCVEFPYKWRLETTLIDKVSAVDTTFIKENGCWWLFTTLRSRRTGLWEEDLYLYMADDLLGPWTEHPLNPVKSDVRASRSAGTIVRRNGGFVRPAQDCSWRYGYGIKLLMIENLSMTDFHETEVATIVPDRARSFEGVHTINQVDHFLTVDGLKKQWRWSC